MHRTTKIPAPPQPRPSSGLMRAAAPAMAVPGPYTTDFTGVAINPTPGARRHLADDR